MTTAGKQRVVIAGVGVIGRALGLILREIGDLNIDLYLGDIKKEIADDAANWITNLSSKAGLVEPFTMSADDNDAIPGSILTDSDIILDCLPGNHSPKIARLARKYNNHYVNTTAYVEETNRIMEIAKGADRGFILQTGLAPGYVNVLANGMYQEFCKKFGVDKVDKIAMKVGALTKNAIPPHYYGFTWSPIGVAEEYFGPVRVIRNYKKAYRPPLSKNLELIIDGIRYEEVHTSGGAADLPDAFEGKTRNLDYKTLRYPGHYSWIENIFLEVHDEDNREERLQKLMEKVIPHVEDDLVVIYASVKGKDKDGTLRIDERTHRLEPVEIGSKKLRAIQSTTAAPIAECARMLLENKLEGLTLQSQIPPAEFLNGPFVSAVYR